MKITFLWYVQKEADSVLDNMGNMRYLDYCTTHKNRGCGLKTCKNCGDIHSQMVQNETSLFG